MSSELNSRKAARALTILNVDLNLLVVLQALLEEKSVTKAARRVCLSQSATSSALSRLRGVFEDPLLIRWSNRMELSRRGLELREPVRNAIDAINAVLGDTQTFDPLLAHSTIRIAASDYVGVTLLPAVEKLLQSSAPGISLHQSDLSEPEAMLRLAKDDVDLVLGHFPDTLKLHSAELFNEKFVCMVRKGHPLVKEAKNRTLNLKQFISYPHIAITRQGATQDLVDLLLSEQNLERNIGMIVTHFMVMPSIVAQSDMIAVEAQRLAVDFEDFYGVDYIDLPPEFGASELPVHMLWESQTDADPCLRWFRELIQKVAATI